MYHILICDDERDIVNALKIYLHDTSYVLHEAFNGKEALKIVEEQDIHLVLMDIMMPEMDGIEAMVKIRDKSNVPVILLTAKSEDSDKILGLTVGADDYITKPFNAAEVSARVKSQLRRYHRYNPARSDSGEASPNVQTDTVTCGELTMNIKAHTCFLDEKPLVLTPTEFSILRILLENAGNVVSSEELFHKIWQDEYYSKSNNTITVHIRHLREKLGDSMDNPRFIKTIWGVGYKIET